ncbi:3-deoxy-8-phosphooctulonate synthase [Paracoccaceae bacterium GXU_MW_L88]
MSVSVNGPSGDVVFSQEGPFALICGPCQIESRDHAMGLTEKLAEIFAKRDQQWIFKASYDKANRSSIHGERGIGIEKGLDILAEIREQIGVPVLTDVHTEEQTTRAGEVVDMLQIPAFLSRQTDLLIAAAKTGKAINVKKGQFLAPWDMKNVAAKLAESGNERITLCERGASFGYNTLVTDFRGIPEMASTGYPVVFDATHSVQQPGGQGTSSGGKRDFAPVLARAAVAVGVGGLFIEAHDDPDNAPSDGPNMLPLSWLDPVIAELQEIDRIAKSRGTLPQYP